MSEKYYVAGCVDNGLSAEVVEDEHAEFWTLYVRDSDGLSEGIIDCVFREDAEAAMAVYVERDRLNEQMRALAADNAKMREIIESVTNLDNEPQYHDEGMGCGLEDRGITDRYEAMSYGWDRAMERIYGEVIPCADELNFTATDTILREVRARAIEGLREHPAIGLLALGSELDKHAAAIRAGEMQQ